MHGEIHQPDLLAIPGRDFHLGREVNPDGVFQGHLASPGHLGQENTCEHLGNGPYLEYALGPQRESSRSRVTKSHDPMRPVSFPDTQDDTRRTTAFHPVLDQGEEIGVGWKVLSRP
jgi:hypothetical protein